MISNFTDGRLQVNTAVARACERPERSGGRESHARGRRASPDCQRRVAPRCRRRDAPAARESSILAGRGDRSEAEGAARLGSREAAVAVRGGTQRGSREAGAGEARTAGANGVSDEDRSERAPASRLGLWRRSPCRQRLISDRPELRSRSTSLRYQSVTSKRLSRPVPRRRSRGSRRGRRPRRR
ncbi:hypothetical protein EXE45_06860 [Halorubrum sp. SP9]|nr:hypothetical protein EXE45_06860 [Halorubrum sp. SP9]